MIRDRYLTVIALFFLLFANGCKKSDTKVEIIGKWMVDRVNIKQQLTAGNQDTTYSSFTGTDYFQFNSNSTATLASSTNFKLGSQSIFINASGETIAIFDPLSYTIDGAVITLNSSSPYTWFFPLGVTIGATTETILSLNNQNLTLQQSATTAQGSTTITIYFTRSN